MKQALSTLLVILVTASCSRDTSGPAAVANVYALENTPVTLQSGSAAQLTIVADTFFLGADPVTRRVTYRHQEGDGFVEFAVTEQYTVRLRWGRLELSMICPPEALMTCVPPPHFTGLPRGTGLELRWQIDPSVRLIYGQVPTNLRS